MTDDFNRGFNWACGVVVAIGVVFVVIPLVIIGSFAFCVSITPTRREIEERATTPALPPAPRDPDGGHREPRPTKGAAERPAAPAKRRSAPSSSSAPTANPDGGNPYFNTWKVGHGPVTP